MIQDTVGFIGLGNLGKAIADNIAKGGFEMCVYDVVGADERAPQGAVVGASVSEVAERSGLIFICLPTVESIETVVDEICSANIADGTVVVNNSTAGPTCAIAAHGRLGKKGIAYADATISATPPRARAAEAIVMFSGEPDVRKAPDSGVRVVQQAGFRSWHRGRQRSAHEAHQQLAWFIRRWWFQVRLWYGAKRAGSS